MQYQYAEMQAMQNKNLVKMASIIFVAVTAAIVLSAVIVMSFIKGEVARAIDDASPVSSNQQSISAFSPANNNVSGGSCSDPAAAAAGVSGAGLPWVPSASGLASVSNSFNNTNSSTSTVTNNVTETTTTDSNNLTISGNIVASGNNNGNTTDSNNGNVVNSGNAINNGNTTDSNNGNVLNSGNTVNSGNAINNGNTTNSGNVIDSFDDNVVVVFP